MSGLSAHATTLAATQSPLDKLVRAQSKRARSSPYAAPPQVVVSQPGPQAAQEYGYGYGYGREQHASYQSAASSTLDSPASSQTPHSPLLHTRFGNTQRYSDLSEADSAYAPSSSDDVDGDGHRPFSHLTAVTGLESAAPDSPTLAVPLPPPARNSDVDPFAFRGFESQPSTPQQQQPYGGGRVPAVVVQSDDGHYGQRQSQHRVASQLSVSSAEDVRPRLNFSRPLRRQPVEPAPPPPPPPQPQPPQQPSQQQQQQHHNPYMRQPQSSPSPQPQSSPQPSFAFPRQQQQQSPSPRAQQQQQQQQPFQFPPKSKPAFQSRVRSPSPVDTVSDEAGLAYASPDPGQELFGGGQASNGSRDRHPYAYVSGAPSNFEYDEAASPVEVSPLTPTPHHQLQPPDAAPHEPWAISPERRRTLPPGFDLRMQMPQGAGDLSPISDESEMAMREHAAAFTLDPRERWEEDVVAAAARPQHDSAAIIGAFDDADPGPVRFADSPPPRALYEEPRAPPQPQPQARFDDVSQPRFDDPRPPAQSRFGDARASPQPRYDDPRSPPHDPRAHRYNDSNASMRRADEPRTEAQRYRDELLRQEQQERGNDRGPDQAQRPYDPSFQQRPYPNQPQSQSQSAMQRPYDPQQPQAVYPDRQRGYDASARQQQMLYRDQQPQMYADGSPRAYSPAGGPSSSPQGQRPYTPQQQHANGPQSALSPQSQSLNSPMYSPNDPSNMQPRAYSPQPQQRAYSPQPQQRARSPIPPRGPSPHPPPGYALPVPGEQERSHTPQQQPLYPSSAPSNPSNQSSPSFQSQPSQQQQQQQFQQNGPSQSGPPQQFQNGPPGQQPPSQAPPHFPPPPPEPADGPSMSRADKGISYYSTQSAYFPPPSAHPPQHVQLPAAPPSPNFGRPGSRNSVYSNYSYYAIPSPTGSGGGTPTEERFGARLVPTATGRETPMGMGGGGGGQGGGGVVQYDAYGRPMQGQGQASGSGQGQGGFAYQQSRGPQQQMTPTKHGREGSEATTLRAARDVLGSGGRASEETIREHPEKRGWFGRQRRPSHESSGRRSPTGSAYSAGHRQYVATLPNPSPGTLRADSAQEYLTLGIAAHEALKLAESAYCFEQAATFRGGCAVGMLMWGLALRHAWGVRKDEKEGFKWLRRAAGRAVEGLEMAYSGKESKEGKGELEGVKTELVLAIYEVGQCFFHGWGVVTDKKMAVSYYQVAARLGDADAQQALAFCYANGRGVKKDLKESAKWYRAAAAQGASTVGLAWIYKTKYGAEEDADGRPAQR